MTRLMVDLSKWNPMPALAKRLFPLGIALLCACSGSGTLSAPSVPAGGPGKAGEPLDTVVGVQGPGSTGLDSNPGLNAAQPLAAGFPAPVDDPTTAVKWVLDVLEEKALCRIEGKDLVKYKISAFVHAEHQKEPPEVFVNFLSQGTIRVVDVLAAKYTDVPFSYKKSIDSFGQPIFRLGFFEVQLLSPSPYHLKFFMMMPKSGGLSSVPWTSCLDEKCAPDSSLVFLAERPPEDLIQTAAPSEDLPACPIRSKNAVVFEAE